MLVGIVIVYIDAIIYSSLSIEEDQQAFFLPVKFPIQYISKHNGCLLKMLCVYDKQRYLPVY